jgi:hypothetical protein
MEFEAASRALKKILYLPAVAPAKTPATPDKK